MPLRAQSLFLIRLQHLVPEGEGLRGTHSSHPTRGMADLSRQQPRDQRTE